MSTGYVFLVSFKATPEVNFMASHAQGWAGFCQDAHAAGSTVDLTGSALEFEYLMEDADEFYYRFAQCGQHTQVDGAPGYYQGEVNEMIHHLMQHIVGEEGGTIRPLPQDQASASFQALCDFVPFEILTRHIAEHVCEVCDHCVPVDLVDEAITTALASPEKVTTGPIVVSLRETEVLH